VALGREDVEVGLASTRGASAWSNDSAGIDVIADPVSWLIGGFTRVNAGRRPNGHAPQI